MAILKMIPGQKINFTVENVEQVQGNFGPQFMFTGATPDDPTATLYLNVSAAERQLERIGFTIHSVLGQTVEIARTEKNGTKYTDINRVSGGVDFKKLLDKQSTHKEPYSSGPHIPAIDGPTAPAAKTLDGLLNLYGVCLDAAIVQAKKLDTANIGSSPEAVAAMAATLFIQANQRGIAA